MEGRRVRERDDGEDSGGTLATERKRSTSTFCLLKQGLTTYTFATAGFQTNEKIAKSHPGRATAVHSILLTVSMAVVLDPTTR